jgi:hypothetical protein
VSSSSNHPSLHRCAPLRTRSPCPALEAAPDGTLIGNLDHHEQTPDFVRHMRSRCVQTLQLRLIAPRHGTTTSCDRRDHTPRLQFLHRPTASQTDPARGSAPLRRTFRSEGNGPARTLTFRQTAWSSHNHSSPAVSLRGVLYQITDGAGQVIGWNRKTGKKAPTDNQIARLRRRRLQARPTSHVRRPLWCCVRAAG